MIERNSGIAHRLTQRASASTNSVVAKKWLNRIRGLNVCISGVDQDLVQYRLDINEDACIYKFPVDLQCNKVEYGIQPLLGNWRPDR